MEITTIFPPFSPGVSILRLCPGPGRETIRLPRGMGSIKDSRLLSSLRVR